MRHPSLPQPLRDLIPDPLKTKSTHEGLADTLAPEDHLVLTRAQRDTLSRVLEQDLVFLERMEVIDYSLPLGCWPADLESELELPIGFTRDDPSEMVSGGELAAEVRSGASELDGATTRLNPSMAAGCTKDADQFIRGIKSADGKWIYRMSIVDFTWNVNKLRPIATKVGRDRKPLN